LPRYVVQLHARLLRHRAGRVQRYLERGADLPRERLRQGLLKIAWGAITPKRNVFLEAEDCRSDNLSGRIQCEPVEK
jgi:hypothetical protein